MICLLFVAGLLVVFFWYLPLIQQNQRYRMDILTLDRQIEAEERVSRDLNASLNAVQTDPRTIERLAREKLGYARPDETVIRFEAPR